MFGERYHKHLFIRKMTDRFLEFLCLVGSGDVLDYWGFLSRFVNLAIAGVFADV